MSVAWWESNRLTFYSKLWPVEPVSQLGQKGCSILLIHGTDDDVLPPICSSYVYNKASNPKHIILFEGAKHGLEESAEPVM